MFDIECGSVGLGLKFGAALDLLWRLMWVFFGHKKRPFVMAVVRPWETVRIYVHTISPSRKVFITAPFMLSPHHKGS